MSLPGPCMCSGSQHICSARALCVRAGCACWAHFSTRQERQVFNSSTHGAFDAVPSSLPTPDGACWLFFGSCHVRSGTGARQVMAANDAADRLLAAGCLTHRKTGLALIVCRWCCPSCLPHRARRRWCREHVNGTRICRRGKLLQSVINAGLPAHTHLMRGQVGCGSCVGQSPITF